MKTFEELINEVMNGTMTFEEMDKELDRQKIEEWKQSVLKSAKEVKEAWEKGINKWVYRHADLKNAEIVANAYHADVKELKQFVDSAYTF